jgi:hypothetical protein
MKSLVQISNQTSTYAINTDRYVKKRSTLKNPYEEKEKYLCLDRDNSRIYSKLSGVESDISCEKIKKFDAKITKYSKLIKRPFK